MPSLQKNVAGQEWAVFAFDRTTNQPKDGDAANILGFVSIDGAAIATIAGATNPARAVGGGTGLYVFTLDQADTNGDNCAYKAISSTENIEVVDAGRYTENRNQIIGGTSPDTSGTTNTSTRIELDANASAVDGAYDPAQVDIVEGTGAGQSRQIWEYDGGNKLAYVNRDWKVIPDDTSVYCIRFNPGNTHVNEGLAQGGGASTITLNSLASGQPDVYLGQMVAIVAGTGTDQSGMCIAYNGTSKVLTIDHDWIVQPDATSIYAMLPFPGFVHGVATLNGSANILMRDTTGNRADGHNTSTLAGRAHAIDDHNHSAAMVQPSGAAGITVVADDGTAFTLGSFVVLSATNNITDDFDIHSLTIEDMADVATYEIVLYSGADASEVEIGRRRFVRTGAQVRSFEVGFQTPIIAANSQIKAKLMTNNTSSTDAATLSFNWHPY